MLTRYGHLSEQGRFQYAVIKAPAREPETTKVRASQKQKIMGCDARSVLHGGGSDKHAESAFRKPNRIHP
jgi:hypothetical protein